MAFFKLRPNYLKLLEIWVKNFKWTLLVYKTTSYFGRAHNT